jgi:hypothetical protein
MEASAAVEQAFTAGVTIADHVFTRLPTRPLMSTPTLHRLILAMLIQVMDTATVTERGSD